MFFGLRNIEQENKSIEETVRVLKDGGQFIYMDFSKENKIFNRVFDIFTPLFAKVFTPKNTAAYEYLVKSKNNFYSPSALREKLEKYDLFLKKEYKFLFSSVFTQVYEIKK